MIHLLDINVLIALCDPAHPHAAPARHFFQSTLSAEGWASCPLIENGFLRIFGDHRYPGGSGNPQAARLILRGLLSSPGHQFWQDDLSLTDDLIFPSLSTSKHLTDLYLLGLAVKHGARFATFDHSIDPSILPGGPAAYYPIPS
jgi:uncharacterized protein